MTRFLNRLVRPAGIEEILALALLFAGLLFAAVQPAPAHEIKAGDLVMIHPHIRATPPGAKVAGGFVTIHNKGTEADRLVSGTADFAGRVEFHTMTMEGDVMKMRPVEGGLEIPAGGSLALKPGSLHVMFMDLAAAPKAGETLNGTLTFEKAGTIAVTWMVQAMGQAPQAEGAMDHEGMDHGAMQHAGD